MLLNKERIQDFFLRRMTEMMHKDTLDSYRVRANNALSILEELKDVLTGWKNGNVKRFSTVDYCLKECISLIDTDECLQYGSYSKELLKQDLDDYSKTQSKKEKLLVHETDDLIYTLEDILNINKNSYFQSLFQKIRAFLFDDKEYVEANFLPTLNDFDTLLSAFGCELIRKGFSKKNLYSYFKSMKEENGQISFEKVFSKMEDVLKAPKEISFNVIIKLSFDREKTAKKAIEEVDNIYARVPEEIQNYITKESSYKRTNKFSGYFITEIKALDSSSASRKGYENFSELLDFNQVLLSTVKFLDKALVISKSDGTVKSEQYYILDNGGRYVRDSDASLQKVLDELKEYNLLAKDVRDRVLSALRHLRIGDSQIEIEQQFINYWIALEFIFSSEERSESTFERIKKYLVQILGTCYIYRNFSYLRSWLIRIKRLSEDDDLFDKIIDDSIFDSLDDVLLVYRLKRMKSHLQSKKNAKEYVKNHIKHLEQHIVRIYRLRNELVHEAAIKQDIMNVTSNLRFYLVFILNQLISFCIAESRRGNHVSMDRFFWYYGKIQKFINDSDIKEGALCISLSENYIK